MKAPIESPLTLEEVAEHFAQWRRRKKKGERIPEPLWSEALGLVGTYGVSQVTRTLRLSGTDLNKRRGKSGQANADRELAGRRPLWRSIRWSWIRPRGRRPARCGWSWNARTGCACASGQPVVLTCWRWSSVSWGPEHVAADTTKPCLSRLRAGGFPPRHRWAGRPVPATARGESLGRGDFCVPQPPGDVAQTLML